MKSSVVSIINQFGFTWDGLEYIKPVSYYYDGYSQRVDKKLVFRKVKRGWEIAEGNRWGFHTWQFFPTLRILISCLKKGVIK